MKRVQAAHNYLAQEKNALKLLKGDKVEVYKEVGAWMYGKRVGSEEVGSFPGKFVVEI